MEFQEEKSVVNEEYLETVCRNLLLIFEEILIRN